MRLKKILIILSLIIVVLLSGCKGGEPEPDKTSNISDSEGVEKEPVIEEEPEPEPEPEPETEPEEEVDPLEGKAKNPLTGLYIDETVVTRRPVGVMISDIKTALPQSGIGQADVIYETLAEGGIPRLYALFQDFDADKIGPVRSARHYFLDFAFDFDAYYVHYGKSPQAQTAFYELNSPHLDGLSGLDSIMCFQDPNRNRPHSTYTSYEGLMAGIEYAGYRTEFNTELDSKFQFSEEEYILDNNNIATNIDLPFSWYYNAWFEYNEEDSMYYRFQYNGEHIDVETGEQLKFKNVIIQSVNMWVISGDTEGRLDMALVSSGKGYYITNGEYIPITWEKTSHYDPTKYYLEDGSELIMNPGKTWIAVLPSNHFDEITFE